MNIFLSNYRYFISGGPERYLFNVKMALQEKGHNIIPFSINYSKNVKSQYSRYFVSPLGDESEVYFDQQKKTPKTIFKTFSRLFYSYEVEKSVECLISERKPDIAYILHYLRKMSPSLLVGLKKRGVPIVVRLSDFAMLCPQAHCLREGKPCTLCVNGSLFPSIQNKCLKNSYIVSTLNALATWYHRRKKYFELIDRFVCTNDFMYKMMKDSGFPEEKLFCLPTFTDVSFFEPNENYKKSNYIIYSGRIEPLKGLHVLIDALNLLKNKGLTIQLKIAGTGDHEYEKNCRSKIKEYGLDSSISFLGMVDSVILKDQLKSALLSVVPSVWFENLPNTIIESYACGTPVLASNLGTLSSCVIDKKTGFLFNCGDSSDLADKIEYCLLNKKELSEISKCCRQKALDTYSSKQHIASLEKLFKDVINNK